MPVVTGYSMIDGDGLPVPAHAHGNNVAFRCASCGGPVLAVIRPYQLGSAPAKPTQCPGCRSSFWVQRFEAEERLFLHCVG